jgi:hypothetical protein
MNSNNNITNPKCSNCKCYFTPEIKSSGQPFKTCEKCRTKDKGSRKCEHDKRKSECKMCGGSQICEHDKRKSQCTQCGGSETCEHNTEKSKCPKCNEKLCYVRYHSKQIKRYLTSTKYEKIKNHYNDNLGCTVEEFINHIKTKVEYFNTYLSTNEQMTLDNIHIDHIKPISQFNLDNADEFWIVVITLIYNHC